MITTSAHTMEAIAISFIELARDVVLLFICWQLESILLLEIKLHIKILIEWNCGITWCHPKDSLAQAKSEISNINPGDCWRNFGDKLFQEEMHCRYNLSPFVAPLFWISPHVFFHRKRWSSDVIKISFFSKCPLHSILPYLPKVLTILVPLKTNGLSKRNPRFL